MSGGKRTLREHTDELKRKELLAALERNGWNKVATADELGIARQSVYRLMRRLGIDLE